jgi:hypothetical protein
LFGRLTDKALHGGNIGFWVGGRHDLHSGGA